MLEYSMKDNVLRATSGGYSEGLAIRDTFVSIGSGMHHMHMMFYEPQVPVSESRVGVLVLHSDQDYSLMNIAPELARRGFRVLAGQVMDSGEPLDRKILDVKAAIGMLRYYSGIEKVVLMGHSGGATLMSAYQAAAERGTSIFRGKSMVVPCMIEEELPLADAMMILDSNWGNGSMTLLSVDPAVVEEGNGVKLDPQLDAFSPANGYDPEGSHYSQKFLSDYLAAQRARNNRIVKLAQERLWAIEHGKGYFEDDEPFVIAGAAQFAPCNRLIPQDVRLVSHTKTEHDLLHADGTVTHSIVRSLRAPKAGRNVTRRLDACVIGTVRDYLTNRAVLAGPDYFIKEDGIEGILWDDTFNCTPGNIRYVTCPLLVMGMTGGYESMAAETIYDRAASEDKELTYAEAACHMFFREKDLIDDSAVPGDTEKAVYDYAADWMRRKIVR